MGAWVGRLLLHHLSSDRNRNFCQPLLVLHFEFDNNRQQSLIQAFFVLAVVFDSPARVFQESDLQRLWSNRLEESCTST